ncbi:hypothetical protein BC835DRAFT_1312493 [Cytidiella melzeri]|nr:hypothetical protein BC835DRAFT_1312493 [Cytidiella melzeri]
MLSSTLKLLILLHFNFEIILKPGKSIGKLDFMSQLGQHEVKGEEDNLGFHCIASHSLASLDYGPIGCSELAAPPAEPHRSCNMCHVCPLFHCAMLLPLLCCCMASIYYSS